jgi:predicted DNA-binding transcriptional regulator AlpA
MAALHIDRRAHELAAAAVIAAYPDDMLLTYAEVGAWLGVHEKSVVRWTRAGIGPRVTRAGLHSIRFRKGDVKAWLRERTDVALAEKARA